MKTEWRVDKWKEKVRLPVNGENFSVLADLFIHFGKMLPILNKLKHHENRKHHIQTSVNSSKSIGN